MEIQEIRKLLKMSQREFANYFEIPVTNIQHWEQGVSKPPAYVYKMMCKIVRLEHPGVLKECL